ncbi:hypothetical protein GVAV_000490 [Gurleya vavrai]
MKITKTDDVHVIKIKKDFNVKDEVKKALAILKHIEDCNKIENRSKIAPLIDQLEKCTFDFEIPSDILQMALNMNDTKSFFKNEKNDLKYSMEKKINALNEFYRIL